MKALNRAFEKAFLHSENEDSIYELISCIGEETGCERISIFEENEEGTCDNTYEWCRAGIVHEQILLQHIEIAKFDSWHERLTGNEVIIIRSQEEIREHDPDVYRMFVQQDIHRAIVTLLAFHGRNFGFCIMEDPDPAVMDDQELIMPGLRYILSSMIYSRNVTERLRRIGFTDTLTGVGNRVSMKEYLSRIDHEKSFGVISVDVIGWDNDKGKALHLEKEQTLLRAGEILDDLFEGESVFRTATGEFVVLESNKPEEEHMRNITAIRGLFREHNLLAAIIGMRTEKIESTVDSILHEVHARTEEEKKTILAHHSAGTGRTQAAAAEDEANITIPKGDVFFRMAEDFVSELIEESVASVVIDINYFNLYNDIFGRKAGNIFLENIAKLASEAAGSLGGICGYTGGDNFCLLVPTTATDYQEIDPIVEKIYNSLEFPDGFSTAMGVYLSDDRRETVISLYDRALRALADIKGDYIRHISHYSPETHRHHREDKLLLMNVKQGLENGEFIFYVQPQVNDRSGKVIGGEALVRWLHEGELISPGRFIPVLEKTGYVYAVDAFVWESVAAWLRSLIDRGITPLPVSVNVSRVDFYFGDIAQKFIELTEKYDIDPALLGVEITESAFTDNMDELMNAIKRLQEAGFHIMMDDFGSGSSSLSMLHSMNLDVLKTDVKFMSRDSGDNRAISIVESVISMAHLIGMSVVTEGVETEEQKENLIALGDNFAQGFYFYRPMPKEQFEEIISDRANVGEGYAAQNRSLQGKLRFREMIRDGLVSETLLDNILRAAAVFREEDERISVLQINDSCCEALGLEPGEIDMDNFTAHFKECTVDELTALFRNADTHPLGGTEGKVCFIKKDGSETAINMRAFLLYTFDSHRIYMTTIG